MSESQHQRAVIDWAKLQRYNGEPLFTYLYAVPNGGKRRPIEAAIMKAEGVQPGVFDLCLDIPCGQFHGMRIEMKNIGGSPSTEQRDWYARYQRNGYHAVFAYGVDEAISKIRKYLGLGPFTFVERVPAPATRPG